MIWQADGGPIDIEGPVVVGRSPSTDAVPGAPAEGVQLVTVSDPGRFVSRSHLVVEPVGDVLRLRNNSSRNPVKVIDIDGGVALISAGQPFEVRTTSRAIIGGVLIDLIIA